MSLVLDLNDYRTPGVRIWAGRERGLNVRTASKLVEFERGAQDLLIRIPEDAIAVSSSFLLALLGDTIRELGEATFRRRVHFEGPDMSGVVNQAIREALDAQKPFSLT